MVFQRRDQQNLQKLNIDTFFIPPVTSAECIIETQKLTDTGNSFNYPDDDFSQG